MKTRLWVLIIALIVCLAAISLYIGWQRTGVGGRVERQFRAKLEYSSGARVELGRFSLGLGYVEIEGLTLTDREERYVLSAERLRLSLSLFDQLLGGLGFGVGIREVFANQPCLRVNLDRLRETKEGGAERLSGITHFLPQRITVSKGAIIIDSGQTDRSSRITDLNGWLEESEQAGGTFRCRGSWGADEGNLIISGTYHDRLEGYQVQGELRGARLSEVLAPILSRRYRYHQGRLEMTVRAAKGPDDDHPHIDGSLSMEVDRLVDEKIGITLRDVRTQARLEGMDVILEGAEASALGGVARAQGRITDLLHPITDLRISLQSIDVGALWSSLLDGQQEPLLCGRTSLQGRLTGPTDDVRFYGHISAPALEVAGHTLNDVQGTVANHGYNVRIDELTARMNWARVACRGELDLSSSPPGVLIDLRVENIDLAAALEGSSLSGLDGRGFMAGRITGPAPALRLRGGFRLQELTGPRLPVETLAGCFDWSGRRLSYRIISSDGSVRLEGGGDGLSLRARHEALLVLDHIPAGSLFSRLPERVAAGAIDGRWIIFWSPVSLASAGQMTLQTRDGARGHFRTSLSATRHGDTPRLIEARLTSRDLTIDGEPVELELHAAFDGDDLWIRELSAGDKLKAFARVGLGRNASLSGQVALSGLRMSGPAAFLRPLPKNLPMDGTLSGGFHIGGTRRAPRLEGRIQIQDGRLGRLHDLAVTMPLYFGRGRLELGPAEFYSGTHKLLILEGFVENTERWQLLARGLGVRADRAALLLPETIHRAEGRLQAVCRLEGPLTTPRLEALLRWGPGRINDLSFDRLQVELHRSSALWHLDRFMADSRDQSIRASGTAPGDLFGFLTGTVPAESPELDVTIDADGEIVSLLPSLTGLIDDAGGRGEMHLRLGGLPGALVVGSGRCRLTDAWIEPAVFIDKIEDLNGWMEIQEDDRFVVIEHLSGTVGDRPLLIGNRRATLDDGLEPMTVPGLGIDLGIITVATEQEGIEVNVPGLMAKGTTGQMRFGSADGQGPLLISGPLESPGVTGRLVLDHLEFTYPRLPTSGETSLSFLSLVHWDLLVEANNDVWYQNDYARLRLGEDISRLHFAGSADEKTLRVVGHAQADRGEITYLDRTFQVKEFELDFEGQNKPASSQPDNRPFVSGQFETTVYDDSTGVATDIYLTLYTTDPQTGERLSRGQWGDFELELSSNDPSDDDRQKILAKLGYSGDYSEKALQLLQVTLGPKLNEVFLRPVIQPVEKTIKRALGIDVIRLQPGLTWNILSQEESPPGEYRSLSRRLFFPRTTLLVGKYLTDSCFLSYLGKFQTRTDEFLDDRLGISHRFGLEYRLSGGTILDIEYDYERDLTEGDKRVRITSDKRIQITHNFPF